MAGRLVLQNAPTDGVIVSHIDVLTSSHDSFKLQKVMYNDVLKSLKSLRETETESLGPILFNLCVAVMSSISTNSNCIQYTDYSTLYQRCKVNKKDKCIKEAKKDLTSITKWTIETNLVFSITKKKLCLSHQINWWHGINLKMNYYSFLITPN